MPKDNEVIDAFRAKLYAAVGNADPINNIQGDDTYISFSQPGIPITGDELKFGFTSASLKEAELAADFSEFINAIPSTNGPWNPTGRLVTNEYWKCIDQPEVPIAELTPDEVARLEQARNLLEREVNVLDPNTGTVVKGVADSLLYERYRERRTRYEDALLKYRTEFTNYMLAQGNPTAEMRWLQLEPVLRSKVKASHDDWVAAGKQQIETAISIRDNLERRGAENVFRMRRETYEGLKRSFNGADYIYTKYFPSDFWDNPSGWTQFSFQHDEVHKVDTTEIKKWGGSTSGSWGLWSWGGSASYNSQKTFGKADTSNFLVRFSLAKIPIRRTWMDAGLFSSRNWRFDPDIMGPDERLSDGAEDPTGKMVAYPTAMLVVRDVEVKISTSSTQNSFSLKEVSGSLSGGWGPFSLKGNYYKKTTKKTHDYVLDADGILIPGMQVIGFVMHKLPQCPNPDLGLNWPQ